jgi:hypothetical protein
MPLSAFVNREAELCLIHHMVCDRENTKRVAIISAAKGMGKSAIIEQLRKRYLEGYSVAFIDMQKQIEIHPIIESIAHQWGIQGLKLTSYKRAKARITFSQAPRFTVRRSMFTSSPLTVMHATASSQDRADYLLDALLNDLAHSSSIPRRLLLIDRYEAAQGLQRKWFEGTFIPRLIMQDAVICVMAGRNAPDIGLTSGNVAHLPLTMLSSSHVEQWLMQAGITRAQERGEFLWRGTKGHPETIRCFVANLAETEE